MTQARIISGIVAVLVAGAMASAADWSTIKMTQEEVDGLEVRLSEPVVIARSRPRETRWGYHQFPAISRLPDGRIVVTYNGGPDRDDFYGRPGPAYVSSDQGVTWTEYGPDDPLLTVSHSVISEVNDGDYLCVPMSSSMDIEKEGVKLPQVSGKMHVYNEVLLYRLKECSEEIQNYMRKLPGVRWSSKEKRWRREEVTWDTKDALVRTRKSDHVLPRPYLDNRILRLDGLLYYADFHLNHLLPDGSHPKNYATWLMVSRDNGRSWDRQAVIAYDTSGELMMGEPCLTHTADGGLACVIRCAHHEQKPMLITYSADKGKTWEEPKQFYDFGVMPQAMLLGNKVMALSFGRPGVYLMFSPDGSGKRWTDPVSVVPGDRRNVSGHSCGYTRMLALDDNSFLLAYSDFKAINSEGEACKAIAVRKIEVRPRR